MESVGDGSGFGLSFSPRFKPPEQLSNIVIELVALFFSFWSFIRKMQDLNLGGINCLFWPTSFMLLLCLC
jgi:hypothetical protein